MALRTQRAPSTLREGCPIRRRPPEVAAPVRMGGLMRNPANEKTRPSSCAARKDSMADHPISFNEPGQGLPALPSHPALTRRRLLGAAGIAAGVVLAPPLGMPAIAPAAAQA